MHVHVCAGLYRKACKQTLIFSDFLSKWRAASFHVSLPLSFLWGKIKNVLNGSCSEFHDDSNGAYSDSVASISQEEFPFFAHFSPQKG